MYPETDPKVIAANIRRSIWNRMSGAMNGYLEHPSSATRKVIIQEIKHLSELEASDVILDPLYETTKERILNEVKEYLKAPSGGGHWTVLAKIRALQELPFHRYQQLIPDAVRQHLEAAPGPESEALLNEMAKKPPIKMAKKPRIERAKQWLKKSVRFRRP